MMVKKYWFGSGCFKKDHDIFYDITEFPNDNMQNQLQELTNIIISFQWNNQTNYIPWEFKMWIDKVIQYNVYNDKLSITLQIHNASQDKKIYLITVIKTLKFIKAKVTIEWI